MKRLDSIELKNAMHSGMSLFLGTFLLWLVLSSGRIQAFPVILGTVGFLLSGPLGASPLAGSQRMGFLEWERSLPRSSTWFWRKKLLGWILVVAPLAILPLALAWLLDPSQGIHLLAAARRGHTHFAPEGIFLIGTLTGAAGGLWGASDPQGRAGNGGILGMGIGFSFLSLAIFLGQFWNEPGIFLALGISILALLGFLWSTRQRILSLGA